MKSVVRISLVALLLAGFAAPASAAPATTPARLSERLPEAPPRLVHLPPQCLVRLEDEPLVLLITSRAVTPKLIP